MITEFSVKPKPQNKKAYYLLWGFLICAAVTLVIYFCMERYKGLVGLFTIGFITAAVFVYTKYIAAVYFYDITFDSASHAVFVVRQRTGKKDTTLCNILLSSIVKVERLTADERKAHTTPQGYVRYVYTPTVAPEVVYIITAVSRYEKAELVIEGTEELAGLLSTYASLAREQEAHEEALEEY